MPVRSALLGAVMLVVVACQPGTGPGATPAPTTAPTPTIAPTPTGATGLEGLVLDLNARGATAKVGSPFLADPLHGQGMTVCVGAETLQTYEFIDHEAALAASTKIDRDDPTNVDGGVVNWIGQPRFWLRDRIIVLYLGDDAATDATLRDLLGPPFAESKEPGGGFLPEPPCQ
jgi:hypothetical protein